MREHPDELNYDWRTRFGMGVRDIDRRVDVYEAANLTDQLLRDPTSRVTAAVEQYSRLPTDAEMIGALYSLLRVATNDEVPLRPFWEKPVVAVVFSADQVEAAEAMIMRSRRGPPVTG